MSQTLGESRPGAQPAPDRNLVVVAGAGTGKTHALVERYLTLLDAHPEWPLESLVAITFTRKAAREMRERVRQELQARARDAARAQRPRRLARLADVDNARIDTIHALCAELLRFAAAEAGIAPDFQVLDEGRARVEQERSIQETLAQMAVAADPALALFHEYDRAQIMATLREQLDQPAAPPLPQNLLASWQAAWELEVARQIADLRSSPAFRAALHWTRTRRWPVGDKLGDLWALCTPLLQGLSEAPEAELALKWLRELRGKLPGGRGSVRHWGSKENVAEARGRLRAVVHAARETLAEIGEGITARDHRAVTLLPHWQRLIEHAQCVWRARKRAANQLDFTDLERLTRDILQMPAVRARFRREFNQVLVDEFHDINPLQWEIIAALARPDEPGRLFIVGDPRQNIYTFRGADVRVFDEARRQILAGGAGDEIALTRSFRAHQPLLDVLHALFHEAPAPGTAWSLSRDVDRPLRAQRQEPPGPGPALELLVQDLRETGLRSDDGQRHMAVALGQRLGAMIAGGRPVHDRAAGRARPLRYGDVALLFQTHRSMPLYEEVFRELELPCVTVDGRGFHERQEVLDLLNLLRALHNPRDDLTLASALRSPLFALRDDALLALRLMQDAQGKPLPLWHALQQPAGLAQDDLPATQAAAACLRALSQLVGRLSVEELLREVLQRTGYLAILAGLPQGRRRRANVEKLLDMAADSGTLLLADLERLAGESGAREGEAALESNNAITLMTVHQAKGLEFPLVVLADAGRDARGPRNDSVLMRDEDGGLACKVFDMAQGTHEPTVAWRLAVRQGEQRALAERRRLLYVAATRARDYLLVCGLMSGRPGENSWLAWLLRALGIAEPSAGGQRTVGRGRVIWHCLTEPPAALRQGQGARVSVRQPAAGAPGDEATTLPLLRRLPTAPARALQPCSVTSLSARYEATVIATGASPWPGESRPAPERSENRALGDLVHEALRWWRPEEGEPAEGLWQRLRATVHSRGWRNETALVSQALVLLTCFADSALCARLATAREVLRELPFIQRYGRYSIHGSIDLLFQDAAGYWTLVDFKTAAPGEAAGMASARAHARRYHLQLGIYAAALLQHPDITPATLAVQLHYLRHSLDVPVSAVEWQRALSRLDEFIPRPERADSATDPGRHAGGVQGG